MWPYDSISIHPMPQAIPEAVCLPVIHESNTPTLEPQDIQQTISEITDVISNVFVPKLTRTPYLNGHCHIYIYIYI